MTTIYETRKQLEAKMRAANVRFIRTSWVEGTSWISIYLRNHTGAAEQAIVEIAAEMKINIDIHEERV